jgi:uncharacterized protein (PEP-CTERM system associated)
MRRRAVRRRAAGNASTGLTVLVGVALTSMSPSYGQEGGDTAPPNGVVVPIPPVDTQPGAAPLAPNTRTPIVPTTGTGFRVTVTGDLQETFTDNAFATADQRKADFITTPGAGLALHDDSAHFTTDLSYSVAGDLYALNPSLDGLRQNLNGVARGELVPQLVAFDARVYAEPIVVGRGTVQSATGRTLPSNGTSGYQDSYGYLAGPTLSNAFGTFALNNFSLQTGGTFFSTPIGPTTPTTANNLAAIGAAQNTIVNTVSEKLSSGPHFSQLQWDGLLQDTETTQQSDNISDRVAQADINYSLNRYVQLLSSFGYEQINDTEQLERGLSGPIATAGFRLTPGPRADLTVQGGLRDRRPTFSGNFRYDIGARSSITGTYTDQITTEQQRLLGNLGELGISPTTGSPINNQTGQNFSVQPGDQLSLDNPLSRFREFDLTLTLHGVRTDYTATLFRTTEDSETKAASLVLPNQTSQGGSIDVNQKFNQGFSGDLGISYSTGTGDVNGGDDKTFQATATLNYQLTPLMSAQLRYSYRDQDQTGSFVGSTGSVVENAIVLSVHRQF